MGSGDGGVGGGDGGKFMLHGVVIHVLCWWR